MTKQHIVPRFKLILFYDLSTNDAEAYFQFLMSEMVPTLHEMGLYLFRAFQTIPGQGDGDHRHRQVEYVAEWRPSRMCCAARSGATWRSGSAAM